MHFLLAGIALYSLYAEPHPTSAALLDGIRQKVRQNLTRLPDYTCRLTVQRSTGRDGARRLQTIDTVHIEVAYLDGNELYAWPGEKFENVKLEEMLPAGGSVGSGDFALHVKSIFLTNSATFTYAGSRLQAGRQVVQFQYRVPRSKSQYVLRSQPNRDDVVSYQGSFWADAQTLLLQRLEITVDDIPSRLGIRRAGSTITYAIVRIAEADFLLPQTSELFIVGDDGRESRNLTRFEYCRQYSGESVVRFAEPPRIAPEAPKPLTEVRIPAGIPVEMSLSTAVDGKGAAIGDPIAALVSQDAARAGTVIVPKGAKVIGRITRVGRTTRGGVVYQVLGLRLSTVEFADHWAQFTASLESLDVAAAQTNVGRGSHSSEALLFVKGDSLLIPEGVHMLWRTR